MAFLSHKRAAVLVLAGAALLLTIGCSAPWTKVQEDVTQYVQEVREPLTRLGAWVASLGQFYNDTRAGDLQQVACASGRLSALIDEGNAAIAALDAVEPPKAVASLQDGVVDGAQELVDKLVAVRTLVCENGDVAAGQEALEELGSAIEAAPDWLDKLTSWLAER